MVEIPIHHCIEDQRTIIIVRYYNKGNSRFGRAKQQVAHRPRDSEGAVLDIPNLPNHGKVNVNRIVKLNWFYR
jgi:hypothetical protein